MAEGVEEAISALDKVVLGWISLLPASPSYSLSSQCAGAFVTVQNVVTEEVRMRIIMRRFESSSPDEDFDVTLKMSYNLL